jgi:hypothetical protein
MMKRLLLGFASLALVLFAAPASAGRVADLHSQPTANVNGAWELNFCWDGMGCATTTWTFRQIAIFFACDAGDVAEPVDAVGLSLGPLVFNQYLSGCKPRYISRNAGANTMSGTMACTDGSGATGTWEAFKLAAGETVESVNDGVTSGGM